MEPHEHVAAALRLTRIADPEGDSPGAPYVLPMLLEAQVHATLALAGFVQDLVQVVKVRP